VSPATFGNVELELTTDFVHWHNITPPVPGQGQYGGGSAIRNVSFLNPEEGWVVVFLPNNTLELYRTSDGGSTWQDEGGVTSAGSAGDELIDFIDSNHGWREVIAPTAGRVTLSSTDDGGETWTPIADPGKWPSEGLLSFASPSNAFDADTLPPCQDLVSQQPIANFPSLSETADGGQTWHQASIDMPPGFTGAQSYDALPTFSSADSGVLPMVLFRQNTMSVAFFVTSDGGRSWSYKSLVGLGSMARTGIYLYNQLPSVTMAGPNTWWVVSAIRPNGSPEVHVTDDAGRTWSTHSPRGLPSSFAAQFPLGADPIQATSATRAWMTFLYGGPSCGLYGTTNGGITWRRVCPG
jgi:photosystem II stability/assembly factor-like uncharacterized protein